MCDLQRSTSSTRSTVTTVSVSIVQTTQISTDKHYYDVKETSRREPQGINRGGKQKSAVGICVLSLIIQLLLLPLWPELQK
ncbi:hypothetical protein EB796_006010 [Bugula neritina]|uniref:Uncharacterized protein n=1 Tax=Bugula neritina TaxID=10212 RepID=A0A7J7KBV0_BUGNE|nr:hypothetical protein EB796_006010 [Bugula neritina]